MTTTAPPDPQLTMRELLLHFPGAQRALFRRYHIGERLRGLEAAARAAADVVAAKERALRAREMPEQFTHGELRIGRSGGGHVGESSAHQNHAPASAVAATAAVFARSSDEWARERKPASNCEGAK